MDASTIDIKNTGIKDIFKLILNEFKICPAEFKPYGLKGKLVYVLQKISCNEYALESYCSETVEKEIKIKKLEFENKKYMEMLLKKDKVIKLQAEQIEQIYVENKSTTKKLFKETEKRNKDNLKAFNNIIFSNENNFQIRNYENASSVVTESCSHCGQPITEVFLDNQIEAEIYGKMLTYFGEKPQKDYSCTSCKKSEKVRA